MEALEKLGGAKKELWLAWHRRHGKRRPSGFRETDRATGYDSGCELSRQKLRAGSALVAWFGSSSEETGKPPSKVRNKAARRW
jgi:hypothetical protein